MQPKVANIDQKASKKQVRRPLVLIAKSGPADAPFRRDTYMQVHPKTYQ